MNDAAQIIGQQENDRLDQQMSDFEDYYARRKNIIENTVLDEEVKNRRLQNLENEKAQLILGSCRNGGIWCSKCAKCLTEQVQSKSRYAMGNWQEAEQY